MKVLVNIPYSDNLLDRICELSEDMIPCGTEKEAIDQINSLDYIDGIIMTNHNQDSGAVIAEKAHKKFANIPVIVYLEEYARVDYADVVMLLPKSASANDLLKLTIHNINKYNDTFKELQSIIVKPVKSIKFGNCTYDPTRRILYHNGEQVKKLTGKEAGIMEILGNNYGKVVNKSLILERVWKKTDIFASRSMDVYLTHLRNLLKSNNIDCSIQNISGSGLILE